MELSKQVNAFWDMLAVSELGQAVIDGSDDGYNVLVGSLPHHILTFPSYAAHPMIHNSEVNSDAAGRGQFMGHYWPAYRDMLKLPDFGPASQRAWFFQLLKECHAVDLIEAGHLDDALKVTSSRWASFPYATYNQHRNTYQFMEDAFVAAGGVVSQA